ncbi:MAG: hypothetical protein ACRDN0_04275, partial [Trebonia sp.]
DEFFAKLAPLDAEQRVTFRRLAAEAQSALHAIDNGPAEEAMELTIDLACHADGCFRSDDPLEAAKFVVSQAAWALWQTVLDSHGVAGFTARAVPQFMRWERKYGWAHGTGAGKVWEAQRPLGETLASILSTPEMWHAVADAYLAELDRIAVVSVPPAVKKNTRAWRDWERSSRNREYARKDRTDTFANWNSALLEHLEGERARRLACHAAFGGPQADFLKARAARQRGDLDEARALITECLKQQSRDGEFRSFAEELGVAVDTGGLSPVIAEPAERRAIPRRLLSGHGRSPAGWHARGTQHMRPSRSSKMSPTVESGSAAPGSRNPASWVLPKHSVI